MGNPKNYNDTNPAAPAGASNVKWQAVAPDPNPDVPRDVSAYMPPMTATVGGAVPTPPNDSTQVLRGNGTWGAGGSGASISSVQQEAYVYSADTGAANAYVVTLSPVPTIIAGSEVLFTAAHANTGASTVAVNGGSATAIKKNGTVDLASGDIVVGQIVALSFDGTNYQMTSPAVSGTLSSDSDVTISSPTDKDILAYKTADSKWENQTASALGLESTANKDAASGYAGLDGSALLKTTEFPALSGDVTTVAGAVSCTVLKIQGTAVKAGMTPSDGDVLAWVAANSDWENTTLSVLGNANASQLRGKNISTTAPFDGQMLRWNTANSDWEPSTQAISYYNFQSNGQSNPGSVAGISNGFLGVWATTGVSATGVTVTATELPGTKLPTSVSGTTTPSSLTAGGSNAAISLGVHRSIRYRMSLQQTTNMRIWIGLSNNAPGTIFAADAPNISFVGFRFSTTTDSKYACVTQNSNVNQTVNLETTASHVDTSIHDFEIRWDGTNVIFLIDGTQVGSQLGTLPVTSTPLFPVVVLDNKGTANAQSFTIYSAFGYTKWTN